ncbi:hypothetical protein EC973_008112 [Apophysomyces ossiformis]|uniref:SAP domain-containing protein n=1 Tax=Apophysomyces ossiformis TaxID=679940 RepID=A0A8H7BLD5_9FUNG|nr:hypothetical protein EC973_008112 [Apophysomyces ossiformis]
MFRLRSLSQPFYSTTRSLHGSPISLQQLAWNRKLLQKSKKAELISIAEAFRLDKSGSKATLIARLVKCQPPPPKYALKTEAVKTCPTTDHLQDPITATAKQTMNTAPAQPRAIEGLAEEDMNQQWVDAFEKKVVYRGARLSKQENVSVATPSAGKTDVIAAKEQMTDEQQTKARYEPLFKSQKTSKESMTRSPSEYKQTIAEKHETINDPVNEEMNQQWVDAFEKKIAFRGSRTLKGQDTLSPTSLSEDVGTMIMEKQATEKYGTLMDQQPFFANPSDPSLEECNKKEDARDPEPKIEQNVSESLSEKEVQTESPIAEPLSSSEGQESDSNTENKQSNPRNVLLNSLLGSGILLWLTTGEDGLKKVVNALIS